MAPVAPVTTARKPAGWDATSDIGFPFGPLVLTRWFKVPSSAGGILALTKARDLAVRLSVVRLLGFGFWN
jgi:hypothetical protein